MISDTLPNVNPDWEYIGSRPVYSNFDHEMHEDVREALLKGNCWANHVAWEFCGDVWYDPPTKKWHERVNRYHIGVAHYEGDSAIEVIERAIEEWGRE